MPSNTLRRYTLELFKYISTIHLLLVLAGCTFFTNYQSPAAQTGSSTGQQPSSNTQQNPNSAPTDTLPSKNSANNQTKKPAKQPSRPIDSSTLLNLLVGELAVHDRNIDLAAEKYISEAEITQDPGVAARAARLARYQRNPEASLKMAKLWYETATKDEKALANYADMLARVDQPLAALNILKQQLDLQQTANFSVLRNSQFRRNPKSLAQAIAQLDKLNAQPHENFSLIFTHTLLLQKNQQNEVALTQLKKLKRFKSDPIQLAVLEARLLSQLERNHQAANVLKNALAQYPDERRLQLPYARILATTDIAAAEQAFANLLKTTPNDTKLLISHALTAADNKNFAAAQQSLQQLITLGSQKDFAYFNLGMLENKQNNPNNALTYFEKVGQGKYFFPATEEVLNILIQRKQLSQARHYLQTLRSQSPLQAPMFWVLEANLLSKDNQLAEAHETLSHAIKAFPEQQMLRIERSHISERLNNIALVEQDLRYVLNKDPKNIAVLNALGYTLAVHTMRYSEALDLIKQAISQKPNDPAIRDSLGWVQYKLGMLDEAEKNLLFAFKVFPEDEIAAHLIELYWTTNNKRKAKKIYRTLDKKNTVHLLVDEVILRLNIQF